MFFQFVMALAAIALTLLWYRRRHRPWDLILDPTSALMYKGSFVPAAKVPNATINACMFFDRLPPTKKLVDLLQKEVVDQYLEFRSVCEPSSHGLMWKDVGLKVEDVMHECEVSSAEELHSKMESIVSHNIKGFPARLWEFHYIRTEGSEGGMIIFRIEHCIADGLGLMKLLLHLVTDTEGKPMKIPDASKRNLKRKQDSQNPVIKIGTLVLDAVISTIKVGLMGVGKYDSLQPFSQGRKKMPVFNPQPSVIRIPAHPLALVKSIKNAANATVNDVVFTCAAGAIKRYCESQKLVMESPEVSVRALVPVGFPHNPKSKKLGNNWSFVSVPFPVSKPTTQERLEETQSSWAVIKNSMFAPVSLIISRIVADYLPLCIPQDTTTQMMARHSVIFSNVPGPDHAICLAGAELGEIQMVFPNLITQFGLLSYNGTLYGNFVVDPKLVPDGAKIGTYYLQELQAMATAYGVAQ